MTWLKQSTAVDIMLGPFVDSTDGFTPETALSITQPDILLSKNGGAFAQKSAAQTLVHGSNGWYPANLSTTDTGTLGSLVVAVYESGALPVWREFMVLPAVVYDSMVAGTDNLQVDTVQVSGTTQTARDLGANLDVAVSTRAAATAMTTAQADLDDIQTRLPAALVGGRISADVGSMQNNVITAAATAADFSTEVNTGMATSAAVAAVQTDVDDIQTRLPAALVGGRIDASVGAMAANTITAAATATDFSTEVNAAVLAVLGALTDAAGTGDPNTTKTLVQMLKQLINSLEGTAGMAWPSGTGPGAGVSLREVVHQIHAEVNGLEGANIDDFAGAVWATTVPTGFFASQAGYILGTNLDAPVSSVGGGGGASAAAIADAVWDELLAGHLGAGSTGEALNGAGAAGDPWITTLPGAYGAGSAGYILGNIDDAVAAVQADTDNIQTRLPATLTPGGMMKSDVINWLGATPATPNIPGMPRVDTNAWFGAFVPTPHTAGYPIVTVKDGTGTGEIDTTAGRVQLPETQIDQIVDETWDEGLSGHTTPGSTGDALADAASGAGGGGTDPWLTALPGSYGAGTAGHTLGTRLDTTVSSRSSHTAADVWTAANRTLTSFGTLVTDVWAAATRTLTQTIPTAIENADALLKRDMGAVGGESSRSPLNALRFLRNRWSLTAGTLTVTREDDSAVAWTAAVVSDSEAQPVVAVDPN